MIIEVRPTTVRHQAGIPIALTVHIENVRNVIAGVVVHVLGADPGWVDVNESTLLLFPGESRTVEVNVLMPESITSGKRQITVQVTETSEPNESILVPVTLEVPERERLMLTLRPPLVRGGSRARFSLRAENDGNTVISRPLQGRDSEARLRFSFEPERLELAPGEQARVSVKIESRRPFWGVPIPRMLSVHDDARTPEERAAQAPLPGIGAQGAFLQRPRLTRAALSLLAMPIVLLVVVGTAVLVMGAILQDHETELDNKESRLTAVSDPDSQAPPIAACPCSLGGRVVSASPVQAQRKPSATATPRNRLRVSGTPVSSPTASGTPGEETTVSVYDPADPVTPVTTVTAGSDGSWQMDGVIAGEYLVRVTAPHRIPIWYPQAVDSAHASPVSIAGGLTRLRPMIIGVALGSITVTVDADDPSDAQVTVRLGPDSVLPGAIVATALQTETASVFRAENLPTPGHFVVVAEKQGYLTASVPVDLSLGQQRDVDTLTLRRDPAAPTPTPTVSATVTAPPTSPTSPATPTAPITPSPTTEPTVEPTTDPTVDPTTPPTVDPTTHPPVPPPVPPPAPPPETPPGDPTTGSWETGGVR